MSAPKVRLPCSSCGHDIIGALCREAGSPKARPSVKLDAVGQRLIHAATIIEAQDCFEYDEKAAGGNMHPIRALYMASMASMGRKDATFHAAVRRLFDCCGIDFMDHEQIENIDDLIAAAFWEVGFDQAERRAA